MAVIKEKDILKRLSVADLSTAQMETMVRESIEKMGVDFGRTVHCRGVHPNREWTNRPEEFESTPEEIAAAKAAKEAADKEAEEKVIREAAEKMMREKELADIKAELAALKSQGATIEGTIHLNKDIDKRSKEYRDSHPREAA